MNSLMKRYSKISVLLAVILIIVGGFLLIKPAESIMTITVILGLGLLVSGGVHLARFFSNRYNTQFVNLDLIQGLLQIIFALVLIFNPKIIASILPVFLGIILILQGVFKLQYSFNLKSAREDKWKVLLIISLITLIAGIFILFNPFEGATAIAMLLGVLLIYEGIVSIIEYISLINVADKMEVFIKK